MGDAVLTRYGSQMLSVSGYIKKTEIYTRNNGVFTYNFIVPECKGQQIDVMLFGGGGGGGNTTTQRGGGGGGNMNRKIIKLNKGEVVALTIGATGGNTGNGGTTSFGTYLSATGGECGSTNGDGGNGGTGGGACRINQYSINANGGHGIYGGGGGGICNGNGGNGGTYGGGGGAGCIYYKTNIGFSDNNKAKPGISLGGWGNGGNASLNATDGLNTMNKSSQLEFVGEGKAGYGGIMIAAGSGTSQDPYVNVNINSKYCGGGGYGGCGGKGKISYLESDNKFYTYGGGGGGYGANGASSNQGYAGGGGGYGHTPASSGGGGYGPDGYGCGGYTTPVSFGSGGKKGVAIISYLVPIQS